MQDILIIVDLQKGVCSNNGTKLDHLDSLLLFANQRIQTVLVDKAPCSQHRMDRCAN